MVTRTIPARLHDLFVTCLVTGLWCCGVSSSQNLNQVTPPDIDHLHYAASDINKAIDVNKLIVVVEPKPKYHHPRVSREFVDQIYVVLQGVPPRINSYLYNCGFRVYVAPVLIDKEPALSKIKPRGWEPGTTFKNVSAIFDLKTLGLIVCEYKYSSDGENTLVETDDPVYAFRHELGHAVDYYVGKLSQKSEFRRIYNREKDELADDTREHLRYYVQEGDAGPEEAFAELFSRMLGGANTPGFSRVSDELAAAFPDLADYIQKQLRELDV